MTLSSFICAARRHELKGEIMKTHELDLVSIIVPLLVIAALGTLFMVYPEASGNVVDAVRGFLGNDFGLYYIMLGVVALGISMFMAFSKYGKIRLGKTDKPAMPTLTWGALIFTATMAADILFFSLSEWALYAQEARVQGMEDVYLWSATYPLFHWGPIAWSFYIVLAVSFGYMLHVRMGAKQKFSEAVRPLFGDMVDGPLGKLIDLLAIFALLAGTATTFSVATPLIGAALGHVFGIEPNVVFTIIILVLVALAYTAALLAGIKGIAKLAKISVAVFVALLCYIFFFGGEARFILEMGFASFGNLVQNFPTMATWTDPVRGDYHGFAQDWTVFFWAYWMAWCVATPFFIGLISKGRTVKNVVLGGFGFGLAGTFTSFIILGNFGLAQEALHGVELSNYIYAYDYSIRYDTILRIFDALPLPNLGLVMLSVAMIIFYSSTFDALTYVVSGYSYKKLAPDQEPGKYVRCFWAVLFIILPIALIFSEGALQNLLSVAIIAAFPIGIVILLICASFFKDARNAIKPDS